MNLSLLNKKNQRPLLVGHFEVFVKKYANLNKKDDSTIRNQKLLEKICQLLIKVAWSLISLDYLKNKNSRLFSIDT